MAIFVDSNSECSIAKAVVAHLRGRTRFRSLNEQVLDEKDFEVHMGARVSGKAE